MDPPLPKPNYAFEPEFRWPWEKFYLPADALFTSLHERFNTRTIAIQEPRAFHLDVIECTNNSATLDEFYAQLSKRKDERVSEIGEAWTEGDRDYSRVVVEEQNRQEHDKDDDDDDRELPLWSAFIDLCRNMSSDRLVLYFDEYVKVGRERRNKRMEEDEKILDAFCPPAKSARKKDVDNTKTPGSEDRVWQAPEPSVQPGPTGPAPVVLEASTTQSSPDDKQTGLPSPTSASPNPPRKRKQENNSLHGEEENGIMGRRASWVSEASLPDTLSVHSMASPVQEETTTSNTHGDRMYTQEQIDDNSGKRPLPAYSAEDYSPISPGSGHDEVVSTGDPTDQCADTDGRQTLARDSSPVVGQTPMSPSPSTPESRSAKRKSRNDDEGEDGNESVLHMVKKRRQSLGAAEACDGVKESFHGRMDP